uniref:Uncharacterized protein n=1 Tax=Rhizophora mucronata TaxID=61149 RepID=A0A2P2K2U7_RHIMU
MMLSLPKCLQACRRFLNCHFMQKC